MGRSSLLGVERTRTEAPGHDTGTLGPSDSSDSGSDMVGVADVDTADPALPVDVALRDDVQRPSVSPDGLSGSSSDAAGTGERRSAGADAGVREAADISVDCIVAPIGGFSAPVEREASGELVDDDVDDDADPDLAFLDREFPDEPEEDEAADPVGDGHSDADLAERLPPRPRRQR